MSWMGEASGLWGVLSKGWGWWRGRRDPARRSAQRLIRAFEAHGVARQQIIRLVPAAIAQSKRWCLNCCNARGAVGILPIW